MHFNKYITMIKNQSYYSMLSTLNAIQIIFRKIVSCIRSLERSRKEIAEGTEKDDYAFDSSTNKKKITK